MFSFLNSRTDIRMELIHTSASCIPTDSLYSTVHNAQRWVVSSVQTENDKSSLALSSMRLRTNSATLTLALLWHMERFYQRFAKVFIGN